MDVIKTSSQADPRRRALVADDDEIMLELMRVFLTGHGYDVVSASSGRDVIGIALNICASIAFLDLAMPDGNGLETCSALRRMPGWTDVPIIIVTHYSIEQGLSAARRAGANGFLCKPIVPDELSWCLEIYDRKSTTLKVDAPIGGEYRPQSFAIPEFQIDKPLPPVGSGWILNYVSDVPGVRRSDVSYKCSNWASVGSRDGNEVAVVDAATIENGPDQDTLLKLGRLFPPGLMTKLLNKLAVAIQEILAFLDGGLMASGSDEVKRRLHNLAGTAGTLGCKALSIAARELEADRLGQDKTSLRFIEVACSTLKTISSYNIPNPETGPALSIARTLYVLVVDDDAMIRQIASTFLRSAGHDVTDVEGAEEAIAAVSTMDFDVVLMDVRMPRVDGLEATRRIRLLGGSRGQVPIVALTALISAEQVAECLEAGADIHLAKPFDPKTLLAAISQVVSAGPSDAPDLVESRQLADNQPFVTNCSTRL